MTWLEQGVGMIEFEPFCSRCCTVCAENVRKIPSLSRPVWEAEGVRDPGGDDVAVRSARSCNNAFFLLLRGLSLALCVTETLCCGQQ